MFERLLAAYGPQNWWPGDGPFEVMVGAILTQRTTWGNVEKALANLREAGALSPDGLRRISEAELAHLVRPSGYYNAKARKLKAIAALLFDRCGGDFKRMLMAPADDLRGLLLSTHGIGRETADSILLYAAGRPYFVIDAYTRRIFSRLGIVPNRDTYDAWQALFMEALPLDARLFNEYHAVIVAHGKRACRNSPLCTRCPLLDLCPAGQAAPDSDPVASAQAGIR